MSLRALTLDRHVELAASDAARSVRHLLAITSRNRH
jgi:hypothetical protein